jgi:hypothetical protein
MAERTFEPMKEGVEHKNTLLKQFTAAPSALRKKFMRLAEQQGFVVATEMTKVRDEAFFGACVTDLRSRRRSDDDVKAFVSRLASLPNDELDFLVVVCIEIESTGKVTFLPGFTRHIERLFESLASSVQ